MSLTTRELHANMQAAGYTRVACTGPQTRLEPGMRIRADDWKAEHRCTKRRPITWHLIVYSQDRGPRRAWIHCGRCEWLEEI